MNRVMSRNTAQLFLSIVLMALAGLCVGLPWFSFALGLLGAYSGYRVMRRMPRLQPAWY